MDPIYEQPDVMELGPVDALTMGTKGCRDDGCGDCTSADDIVVSTGA